MLAYAFKVLNEQGYKKLAAEDFENSADLCAAILIKGVTIQLKRGLGRDYMPVTEPMSSLRGKIDVTPSIKALTIIQKQMVCSYDIFSVNTYMNRIIKSTMVRLLSADIQSARKRELRKLLVFFSDVELLDLHSVNWNFQYNRNNQTYQMIISICYLAVNSLLQTEAEGSTKLMAFSEDYMYHLYEKFILSYYKREFPQITADASKIDWDVPEGTNRRYLPDMQSDIMLSYKKRTLIIDAKYYAHSLRRHYDRLTIYSANLYQIFTYVKNTESKMAKDPHESVSGMLLYARTEEEGSLNEEYLMSGNRIAVRTLDMNGDFESIKRQLNEIAFDYLDIDAA